MGEGRGEGGGMPHIKRAIISVHDKTGIVEFVDALHKLGIQVLSTGGTARILRDNKIPVTEVSDYTGSPEILDGRLKTLHPKIHGGILGIRGDSKHKKEMVKNGIEPIDMVVVNLYPFEATVAKPDCSLEDAVENIDIGGPTMLRAAAKNWQDVAVVVEPADYRKIADELKKRRGEISRETCFELAQKAFATTARYEAAICNYLNGMEGSSGLQPAPDLFPSSLALTFTKVQDLRYGENPHQKAAFYRDVLPNSLSLEGGGVGERVTSEGTSITSARQLHGKKLSYNNIMDADAALGLAKEFADKTAAVIIKHTNPCGVAISNKSLADAFIKARDCDPTSAFGGIVALTKPVDVDTAKAIGDTFFEVIIAPGFKPDVLEILQAKKNLRLLELSGCPTLRPTRLKSGVQLRKVSGGLLVQDFDDITTDVRKCKVVTKRKPTEDELDALDFAWRVVKHVKSNAIAISTTDHILGIGAGQTSRVDSMNIALVKAGFGKGNKNLPGAIVVASDAFFPFRDSIDLAFDAGITAIIQPGGSIRDDEVIKAADEHNITMIFTGIRHFRH